MSTTALITGGTSGIGRAVANKLAQLGVHVLVVGRNGERGEKTIAEIRAAGGQADFISSDLQDASSAREVARRAVEHGNGYVDILVNNAGIYPVGPTHEMSEELFDKVFSLNVKVPYFLVAELAPLMAKKGKGAIVNLSTMVADYGAFGMSFYGSSKAAINLLTKAWTAEYGSSGVRINAVSPGPTPPRRSWRSSGSSNNPIYRFVARWRKSESQDPRSIDDAISIKPAGRRRWTIAVLGLIGCGTVSPMTSARELSH